MLFLRVDASSPEGERTFDTAALMGHPSFLILLPDGTEIWRVVGQQEEATLVAAVENAIRK